jgi:hypothetical protein
MGGDKKKRPPSDLRCRGFWVPPGFRLPFRSAIPLAAAVTDHSKSMVIFARNGEAVKVGTGTQRKLALMRARKERYTRES